MLSLDQIKSFYPASLHVFPKNMLREYLQYFILQVIFDTKESNKFSFLGGTALRIVYGTNRFSEDLDFDNFELSQEEFFSISEKIQKSLSLAGYNTETRHSHKGAYTCDIKIMDILYKYDLSQHTTEKVLVKIDTQAHGFKYNVDKFLLNKFGITTQIYVTPVDILLAQKIYAIFNRKRTMGRDLYDTMFLMSKTKPNYEYLDCKLKINNPKQLRKELIAKVKKLNLEVLSNDVANLLFDKSESKRLLLFPQLLENSTL